MGNFIGCVGAAFILAAAAAVIVKFLTEINVITNIDKVRLYGKVTLVSVLIASAYLFVCAYIFNCIHGRTNFFDFNKIFAFLDIGAVTEQCQNPSMRGMLAGMLMPLYPCLVKLIGRVVFEQYMLTAVFINVVSLCVSSCVLYSMLAKRLSEDKTVDIMLFICSLPFAFLIFAPTYVSMTLMFFVLGLYSLKTNSPGAFAAYTALACLSSKAGLIILVLYALFKSGKTVAVISFIDEKLTENVYAYKITMTVSILLNGAVLAYLIKGAA